VDKLFVEELNARLSLETERKNDYFVQVDQYAGGTKAMEVRVYVSATNYLFPHTVVPIIEKLVKENSRIHFPFGNTDAFIQLFALEQEQNLFKQVYSTPKMTDKEVYST
jgi:hypothetical protein